MLPWEPIFPTMVATEIEKDPPDKDFRTGTWKTLKLNHWQITFIHSSLAWTNSRNVYNCQSRHKKSEVHEIGRPACWRGGLEIRQEEDLAKYEKTMRATVAT